MPEGEPSHWIYMLSSSSESPDRERARCLARDGISVAPPTLARLGELLPRRRPAEAACRICGSRDDLSREHIPPRSSGNAQVRRSYSILDWLDMDSIDETRGGRIEQGGTFGFVLCRSCNSRTGRNATEFSSWVAVASQLIAEQLPSIEEFDSRSEATLVTVRLPDRQPGRFSRQVMAMMVGLAAEWPVTSLHPELRGVMLDGESSALPLELSLGLGLCAGPWARYSGPSLIVSLDTSSWRWIVSLGHPPFAFELVLARSDGEHPPSAMCEIGNFLAVDEPQTGEVELELLVGFTHTPFPGDWRTRGQVESGRDIYGRLDE